MLDPSKARDDALKHWQAQAARKLVVGYLVTDRPQLDEKSGFYFASMGDAFPTQEDYARATAYCDGYNQAIATLMAEHGLPEWAPGRRLPDRHRTLEMVAGNLRLRKDISESTLLRHRVSGLVCWMWHGNGKPTAWADFPDIGLTMLVGDLSPRCGLIEVYDSTVRPGFFIAKYEYRRRHYPQLPWDGLTGTLQQE